MKRRRPLGSTDRSAPELGATAELRHEGIGAKERLIRGYRTQADALFPAGRVPAAPEVYYCPRRRPVLG